MQRLYLTQKIMAGQYKMENVIHSDIGNQHCQIMLVKYLRNTTTYDSSEEDDDENLLEVESEMANEVMMVILM